MYDAGNNRFVPLDPTLAAKLDDPDAVLTEPEKIQRGWTRFAEGETVEVKGIKFRVHEIGESRLILKPIEKDSWQGK